jgi:beta-galactosidase
MLDDVSSRAMIRYTVRGDGGVTVAMHLVPGKDKLPELPRFGLNFRIQPGFEKVAWYGRGPQENYSDRKTGAFMGVWNSTVDSLFTKQYVRPQENGYRTDVRWVMLSGAGNAALLIKGNPLIGFSALHYTYDDLKGFTQSGKHPADMEKKPFIDLNIDLGQQGVGGDDSWGARVHPEYTLPAREYAYEFTLLPVILR